jgi:hypothetical protein
MTIRVIRFFHIHILILVLLSLLLLTACSGSEQTEYSSATFNLQWEKPAAYAVKTVNAAAPDICSDYGLQTITASFIDNSGTTRASANWACSDHQGIVSGIPVASNYSLRIEGALSSGTAVVWRGEKSGVDIVANVVNSVGTVTMNYIGSVNTSPLKVSSTIPVTGSSSVAITAAPSIVFSDSMAPSTINNSTITLTSGGTFVAGTVSYGAATKTATFTPTTSLSNSATYVLTVTTAAKDQSGRGLATAFTSTFTTIAAVANPTQAVLTLSTQGAVAAATIAGVELTITLPTGVTLKADANGTPNAGVVSVSGVAPNTATMVAKYFPAAGATPGSVAISLASSTEFNAGEFVTVTGDIASGTVPLVSQFATSGFTAFDGTGAALSGISAAVGMVLR